MRCIVGSITVKTTLTKHIVLIISQYHNICVAEINKKTWRYLGTLLTVTCSASFPPSGLKKPPSSWAAAQSAAARSGRAPSPRPGSPSAGTRTLWWGSSWPCDPRFVDLFFKMLKLGFFICILLCKVHSSPTYVHLWEPLKELRYHVFQESFRFLKPLHDSNDSVISMETRNQWILFNDISTYLSLRFYLSRLAFACGNAFWWP